MKELQRKWVSHKYWTEEEMNDLKEDYPFLSREQLIKKYHRTFSAIGIRARLLNFKRAKRWTNDEIKKLKKHYSKLTPRELSKMFNRKYHTLRAKALSLGLHRGRFWTEEELKYLEKNYPYLSWKELELCLNRNKKAIRSKAFPLGLIRTTTKVKNWTKEDYELFKKHLPLNEKEVIDRKHIFRSYNLLHDRMRKLKPKPLLCEDCNQVPPKELANISHKYHWDINDFRWLCKKCHRSRDIISYRGHGKKVVNNKLKCARCLNYKPLKEFYKDKHKTTGYYSRCKTCDSQYQKERRKKDEGK